MTSDFARVWTSRYYSEGNHYTKLFSVCDTLIVIANPNLIGNCLLIIFNGISSFAGFKSIRRVKTVIPALFPVIMSAFITYSPNDLTINLVPLQRSSSKFKFLNKIIIAPIFKINLGGGRPFGVIELRNSIGIEFCKHSFSSSTIEPILKYSLLSSLSQLNISLFILSILLFVGDKIILFFIKMSTGLILFPKI